MKEQSIVHIKVDYDEALQSKRDILSSERDFLRIIKRIKRYKLLRGEELNNRIKIQNKLKKKEEAKKKEIKEEKQSKIEIKEIHEDDDLERQLIEIQEKLRKLG